MTLATATRRRLTLILTGMLVAAGLLATPVSAAHAVNMGVLVDPGATIGYTGPGRACTSQNAPGVYLYSDNTYRGKCGYWEFGQSWHDENTLRAHVGNDKVSSMRIVGDGRSRFVLLYKHNGHRVGVANNVYFTGDVPDFKAYKFEDGSSLNDNVSSLYIS